MGSRRDALGLGPRAANPSADQAQRESHTVGGMGAGTSDRINSDSGGRGAGACTYAGGRLSRACRSTGSPGPAQGPHSNRRCNQWAINIDAEYDTPRAPMCAHPPAQHLFAWWPTGGRRSNSAAKHHVDAVKWAGGNAEEDLFMSVKTEI